MPKNEIKAAMQRADRLEEDMRNGDMLARREYWALAGPTDLRKITLAGEIRESHTPQPIPEEPGRFRRPAYDDVLLSFAGPFAPYNRKPRTI